MPDTSQLFTNEPFINEDNANKFLITSSRSDCITKKTNKRIKQEKIKDNKEEKINITTKIDKRTKKQEKKTKRKNKKTLISHHIGVRERKA